MIALIDSNGKKVVEYKYDAWGRILSKTGTMASTLGTLNPFRYRGYVYDEETGLYYLRSRYYNPEWARFVNADNIVYGNLFMYCNNNSITFSDNDGNIPAKGYVEAFGTAYSCSAFSELSVVKGICFDGYGNVAEFTSFVGVQATDDPESFVGGVGGIGASVATVYQNIKTNYVWDLNGDGSYVGGSIDVGLSIGYDGIVLGERIAETGPNSTPDGYQISFGIGLGLTWVHVGDSYTFIKMLKYGEPEPSAKKKTFTLKKRNPGKRKVDNSHSLREVHFIY